VKTIDEAARAIDENAGPEPINPQPEAEMVEPKPMEMSLSWLWNQTGEGEIEDYMTHPLNFTGQRWNARLIRGVTGMFGNLRYALVDIVMAGVDYWSKREGNGNAGGSGSAEQSGGTPANIRDYEVR
jgi:hypothetical protein